MSGYAETLSKHRRLTILKFLADSPEYTSNASILECVCNDFGVTSSRDQVMGDLDWLQEQGLASFEDNGAFRVATATSRGVDVASGKARNNGVQRPRPGG
jgi:Fe2+ or Zn2+ uptake regulation protein